MTITPAAHSAHLFFIHSPTSSPNSFLEQMVCSNAYGWSRDTAPQAPRVTGSGVRVSVRIQVDCGCHPEFGLRALCSTQLDLALNIGLSNPFPIRPRLRNDRHQRTRMMNLLPGRRHPFGLPVPGRPRLVPLVQGNDNGPFALEQTICSKNEFGDEVGE